MPQFVKVTCPKLNGQFVPVQPDPSNDDHAWLKDWLTSNYSNFDGDSFTAAKERQAQFNESLVPLFATKKSESQQGDGILLFYNRNQAPNNYDQEFKGYIDFFLAHQSWSTPGTIQEITINSESEVPSDWLELEGWYWPGD